MPPLPPTTILRGIRALHILLCSVIAILSNTLIKSRLIPLQLDVIGTVGALFILVSLLLTLVYWNKLHKYLNAYVIISGIALMALTFIQLQYVITAHVGEPITPGGQIPEQQYLIGFKLTEYGEQRGELLGSGKSEKEYIELGGEGEIPKWYGSSFEITKLGYALFYMIFVVSAVLTLAGVLRRSGNIVIESQDGQSTP